LVHSQQQLEQREARVPGTDKTVKVAATTVAKFKVGKALKEAVAK
jgi:DNA-binding protein HU-beta